MSRRVLRKHALKHKVAKLKRKLKTLNSYSVGKYGEQLGVKATTECVEVTDARVRRVVRREVVRLHLGDRPKRAVVCHRCDNPKCVRADHLFWGSQSDNMRDCLLKGRMPNKSSGDLKARIARVEEELRKTILTLESLD